MPQNKTTQSIIYYENNKKKRKLKLTNGSIGDDFAVDCDFYC